MSKKIPKVEEIQPYNPARPNLPRCQHDVKEQTARWRIHCGKSIRCNFQAHYYVNGIPLCQRHAGMFLINLLCRKTK